MDKMRITDELIRDESFQTNPYFDCGHEPVIICPKCNDGVLTIGVGRNLQKGISRGEGLFMCSNDIDNAAMDLNRTLPWWTALDENRQRVFLNMVFNMGISRFLKFKDTIGFAKLSQFEKSAKAMLDSTWAKQVGPRAIRLSEMFEQGGTT